MIPLGTRFIGIAPTVNLTEKKSALINSETQPYTIDDITNVVKPYKVYTALLTQTGDSSITQVGAGNILEGVRYSFAEYELPGWDFTNVGGPKYPAFNSFTATATAAPISWSGVTLEYNAGAPVVKVLENTLGDVTFVYNGIGLYSVYSNGLFVENKTMSSIMSSNIGTGSFDTSSTIVYYTSQTDDELIGLVSVKNGTPSDDLLSKTPIEIRVYN